MCINNNWCYSFGGPCDSDQMVLAGVSRSTFYNYYSSWNIYFVQYYVVQINEFLILILILGRNCCVISKLHVPDENLAYLCLGSDTGEVEEPAIWSGTKVVCFCYSDEGMF